MSCVGILDVFVASPPVRLDESVVGAGRGRRGRRFLLSAVESYKRSVFVELGQLGILVLTETIGLTALKRLLIAVERTLTSTDIGPTAANTRAH